MSSKYSNIEEESFKPFWRERAKNAYSTVEDAGARENYSEEYVAKILNGSIDIHIHGYPETLVDTGWDFAWEAKSAYDAGMRAIVCKSMHIDTAPAVYFVQQIIDKYASEKDEEPHPFNVFGGVVLNRTAGGINPIAAETSAKVGAKIIWLPSHDSAHHMKVLGEGQGIEVLDKDDNVLPELIEIFKIVAKYDIILDLCHTSTKERFIITEEAQKYGVKKILLSHPTWSNNRMTIDQMADIAKLGAYIGVYEYCEIPSFNSPNVDRNEVLEIIKKVGVDKIVMATDYGTMLNVPPVEGMKLYIRALRYLGVSEEDIRTMIVTNPSKLLGV
jgi:hypothetical protein